MYSFWKENRILHCSSVTEPPPHSVNGLFRKIKAMLNLIRWRCSFNLVHNGIQKFPPGRFS